MRTTRSIWRLLGVGVVTLALMSGCGGCDEKSGNNATNNANNANNGGGDAANNGGGDAANDGGGDAANNGAGDAGNNGTGDAANTADMIATDGQQQDSSSPFTVNDAGMVDCGGEPCACDNGIDDDGDGLIDGFDPECTGPFDNDEGTFATGIPGDNQDPKWQDCFFDGNSGAGDDKCRYHTDCLTGDLPQDDPDCVVSQACLDFCKPLTPNGCDCFGCCEVLANDGVVHNVVIGGNCSVAGLGTDACMECVPTDTCINTCGRCELCLGKEIVDLPADCFTMNNPDGGTPDGGTGTGDGGGGDNPGFTCDEGQTVCQSSTDCGNNQYCQLGCCISIVP